MVERRYAMCLRPTEPGSEQDRPVFPVIAVVRPTSKVNDIGPHLDTPRVGWALTILWPRAEDVQHRGLSWDEVVRISNEAGVEDYMVWSPELGDYARRATLPEGTLEPFAPGQRPESGHSDG